MSWKPQHAICLCTAFLLALFLHSQAHADTYQLFQFTDYNGAGPVLGIDNSGDVLYRSPCSDTTFNCYSVFQPFGPGYTTTNLTSFLSGGGGPPCPPNPPLASFGLCNNGFEAYWISPAIGGQSAGVYGGPISNVQRFPSFVVANPAFFFLDSSGDIAWTDGDIGENFLAYDITAHQTPEPSTLALLTTGLALLATLARRRLT